LCSVYVGSFYLLQDKKKRICYYAAGCVRCKLNIYGLFCRICSIHDATIFRNSDLWRPVTANENVFFPNNEFIIGDKAYPILSWCLAPYINTGNLTEVRSISRLEIFIFILFIIVYMFEDILYITLSKSYKNEQIH